MSTLTPSEAVAELDKRVVGQLKAKRAMAVAIRNRWRRSKLPDADAKYITPKNVMLIGPTGVGKTEIARNLAKITNAPMIKVEATKFTEVGYVGAEVSSIIESLVNAARATFRSDKLSSKETLRNMAMTKLIAEIRSLKVPELKGLRKDAIVAKVEKGELEHLSIQVSGGFWNMPNSANLLSALGRGGSAYSPKNYLEYRMTELANSEFNLESVKAEFVNYVEQEGIVFIDEIDKIAVPKGSNGGGKDVSREGVQRDLLTLVEGTSVGTSIGMVDTSNILFIAAGAFHVAAVSDLMPEFQGRFPIRVELDSLSKDDLIHILRDVDGSLSKQYVNLMSTEGCKLTFTDDAITAIAERAVQYNTNHENLGARRLYTLMEMIIGDLSFNANIKKSITIDEKFVYDKVPEITSKTDVRKYLL